MKKHTLDVDTLRRINKLCELGARPPVIKALLPTANPVLIRSQWEAIQGTTPPKGRLPLLVEWFFSNYQIKLQASYIAALWRRGSEGKVHWVDAYIASYEQYLETFPEPMLTFDRAWYLIRTLSTQMMTTTVCPDCNTEYIQNPDELINHKTCPCCRVFSLRQVQPKEQAKETIYRELPRVSEPIEVKTGTRPIGEQLEISTISSLTQHQRQHGIVSTHA